MKIFVTGGTGAVGRPLIRELLAKGHSVVALTRHPEEAQALMERGIEPAIANVFDTDAVKSAVTDAVYYGTQMRGVSNARAKRELGFRP